jgi:hypothetical protein
MASISINGEYQCGINGMAKWRKYRNGVAAKISGGISKSSNGVMA